MLERQELRRVADIGWLATQRGMLPQALRIFSALELARPDSAAGFIGLAMAHVRARALDEALRAIDRGLRTVEPSQHPELHAFRGFVLKLAGRGSECEKALRQAGEQPLARVLLAQEPALQKVV